MPPDEKRMAELTAWLEKAAADLESADVLLASGIPTQLHQVLFHSQQAVEKSLKAFLVWHLVTFRRTHDIAEIGDQCTKVDVTLEPIIEDAKYLSDYAWAYRYPGEDPDPKKAEAKAGLEEAKKVFREIANRLPEEVQAKFRPSPKRRTRRTVKRRLPVSRKKK